MANNVSVRIHIHVHMDSNLKDNLQILDILVGNAGAELCGGAALCGAGAAVPCAVALQAAHAREAQEAAQEVPAVPRGATMLLLYPFVDMPASLEACPFPRVQGW